MKSPTMIARDDRDFISRMSAAARDVLKERARQISSEGWTLEHDDEHTESAMASAALCYVYASIFNPAWTDFIVRYWPWDQESWKPSGNRRNLVKAAALIVAEIERLDRASSVSSHHSPRRTGE